MRRCTPSVGSLAEPAFPGDDGSLDPILERGFAERATTKSSAPVIGALCEARILTPVVALLDDIPTDSDKEADMAAVLMQSASGKTGLIAFSSLAAMQSWNPTARPVPVYARNAAQAALDEGASALLLDFGLPTFTVIDGDDLSSLAAGHRLVETPAGFAWVTTG